MNIHNNNSQKGESSLVQTIMVLALIVSAFFIGMLWTKVQSLEKGPKSAAVADSTADDENAVPGPPKKIVLTPISDKDHIRGNKNARVVLVEYSDLECPFCKTFHPTAKQMLETYGDKVAWVFRHFPLDQLHSKARNEAMAAECAAKLGGNDKFWAYIDKVYEVTPANNGLDPAQLPIIAGQLGLNVQNFNACLTAKETAPLVSADYQTGIDSGITGTPGNILLDTKTGETFEIPGAVPFEELKTSIDSFMAGLQ